jgi:hypothetical protein
MSDGHLAIVRQDGANAVRQSPRKAIRLIAVRLARSEDPSRSEAARLTDAAWLEGAHEQLKRSNRCRRCARRLTDEASIERGLGADCANRGNR